MASKWCVKGASVDIEGTEFKARIISDITFSGGEVARNTLDAVDGTTYTCPGTQDPFEVSFDVVVLDGEAFTVIYGAGTTVGTVTTWTFLNDGNQVNTITIDFGLNADGHLLKWTMTDALSLSGIPKFEKGSAAAFTMTVTVEPQNFDASIDTSPP